MKGGDVYVWGSGEAVGVPCDKERTVPLPTRVPLNARIVQVACGDTFTIALTEGGGVLYWGSNRCMNGGVVAHVAVEIPGLHRGVTCIAAGQSHALAVVRWSADKHLLAGAGPRGMTADDNSTQPAVVVSWGNSFHGCLGFDDQNRCAAGPQTSAAAGGSLVVLPYFSDAEFVAAGYANSACITAPGDLYVWGDNRFDKCCGTIGDPSGSESRAPPVISVPVKVTGLSRPVRFCSLGSLYSAAIDCDGRVFTWGYGGAGNLGHGDRSNVSSPKQVRALEGLDVVHVSCTVGQINPVTTPSQVEGRENPHTIFCVSTGQVFTCGTCHKGILGNRTTKVLSPVGGDELVPYLVGSESRDGTRMPTGYLANKHCVASVSGSIHSCIVTKDGLLYSFGCASGGRMGITKFLHGLHGGRSRMKCYVSEPTVVETFASNGLAVLSAASSRRHMAAVVIPQQQLVSQTATMPVERH